MLEADSEVKACGHTDSGRSLGIKAASQRYCQETVMNICVQKT